MKKRAKILLPLLLSGLMLNGCFGLGEKGETGPQGEQGEKGDKGDNGQTGSPGKDGVSILSIVKTKTDGLVDTYTITFSNQTSQTFNVTNGADGESAYESYCKQYDYEGSLVEWLEKFYSEDETDYTKYGDFLFSEVTYGGVVGYAANYIGEEKIVKFPKEFKKLPVLLATIEDSSFSPKRGGNDVLPKLEEIYFPSSVKFVSIPEAINERYDVSHVITHAEGNFDKFNVGYDLYDLYFEGTTHEEYWATNLRKFFPFSSVSLKNGDNYVLDIDGEDQIAKFLSEDVYLAEGNVYDQILAEMGGTDSFFRFGDFEKRFPTKFTTEFDGVEIELPFRVVEIEGLENTPGLTFENNILKGDSSKYICNGYEFRGWIDIGIPEHTPGMLKFYCYKPATKVKINGFIEFDIDPTTKITNTDNVPLEQGHNTISIYNGDDFLTDKVKFHFSDEIETDLELHEEGTKIFCESEFTRYFINFNLNNYEIKALPEAVDENLSKKVAREFKNDNNFVGLYGMVCNERELVSPKTREIEVEGKKYELSLTYEYEFSTSFDNTDTDHPTVFYNQDDDSDKDGVYQVGVTIIYSIGGGLIEDSVSVPINVYSPGGTFEVKFGTEKHLIRDISSLTVWKLNDMVIEDETHFMIMLGEHYKGLFNFAEGSLGEIEDNMYVLQAGTYNVTLDLVNETILFEESNGEYINKVKVGFFEHLKEEGFNVYVEDADHIVLFDTSKSNSVDKTFDIAESDTVSIEAHVEIKEGDYYSITSEDEVSTYISLGYSFNGIQDNDSEKGFVVSIRADGYFIDAEDVLFHCTYRHCPANVEEFHIEDVGMYETVIDGNVFHLNGVYLDYSQYQIHLQSYNPNYPVTLYFVGGEGEPFTINADLKLLVPSSRFGHQYNFVFDFNTLTVTVDQID